MSQKVEIPVEEIKIEPTSGLDQTGKVFRWNKEVYRGIYEPYADFYRDLFLSSLGKDLTKIGLIPTEIIPCQLDHFGLVLKHQTIPIISYALEWCSSMLKDAALLTCDIQLRLLKSGFTLKDGHPWNVLFDACTPRFVDIGSISRYNPTAFLFFVKDFRQTFIYPLLLKYGRLSRLVYALLFADLGVNHNFSVSRILFRRIPLRAWFYHRRQGQRIKRLCNKSPAAAVKLLRKQVEAIPVFSEHINRMSPPNEVQSAKAVTDGTSKLRSVSRLLDELRPKSVLNIYADDEHYSQLAESKGVSVIAAHTDEIRLNVMYHQAKIKKFNILPIILDICNPTLSHGIWGMCRDATSRFKSELVILLDHLHHLVLKRHRTFHDIASYLFSFSEKWALIEFVEPNDENLRTDDLPNMTEYNLNNLMKALRLFFPQVALYRKLDRKRSLVLCNRQ